jgi:hypothetical protein
MIWAISILLVIYCILKGISPLEDAINNYLNSQVEKLAPKVPDGSQPPVSAHDLIAIAAETTTEDIGDNYEQQIN